MRRFLQITTVLAALCAPLAVQAVPLEVAHQGELQDADGPVTDTVQFTFRLFDAEEDGSEVWTEVRSIDVVDGSYSVLLGSQTAIDSVLFTEPALWLEITVESGSPMLPRQPIASAPYAIVANTAVNVDGGTVNASSISIGSTEVIDASGSWTGGAGSVNWNALTGTPADADTLGGLSCADGDRAVWNDGLSLWECGSATVTLDRLDISSAVDGQVLTYDGGLLTWETPGGGGSPCELVLADPDISAAKVECGSDTVVLRAWSEFSEITLGRSHGCGLRTDGTVACWGRNVDGQTDAPAGTFVAIAAGSHNTCAVSTSGGLSCWGLNDYGQSSPPGGVYSAIAAGEEHACALTTGGAAVCWGRDVYGQATPPGGVFDSISAFAATNCALTSGGAITCWGYDAQGQATPPSGVFTELNMGSNFGCAIQSGGALSCWGVNGSGESTPPSGTFTAVGAGNAHACGVQTGGQVVCWGANGAGQISPPDLEFVAVSAGLTFSCGLPSTIGRAVCWGGETWGQLNPP